LIGIPFDEKLAKKLSLSKPPSETAKKEPVPCYPSVIKHNEPASKGKKAEKAPAKPQKVIRRDDDSGGEDIWRSHPNDLLFQSPPNTSIFASLSSKLGKKEQKQHESVSSELVLPREKIMIYRET